MGDLAVTVFFGFVALVLSYGFFVPSDLKFLNVVAVAGSVAGYFLGNKFAKKGYKATSVGLLIVFSMIACVVSSIGYHLLVDRATGEVLDVVWLACLLLIVFFSLSFLIAFAGISLSPKRERTSKPKGSTRQ